VTSLQIIFGAACLFGCLMIATFFVWTTCGMFLMAWNDRDIVALFFGVTSLTILIILECMVLMVMMGEL